MLTQTPWSALRAVSEHRVYTLPDAAILERPGPRYNDGLAWLIATLKQSPDVNADRRLYPTADAPQRALVVAVDLQDPERPLAPELAEFVALAKAAGADVVGEIVQKLQHVDPATLVGSGKAREIAERAEELERRRADGVQRPAPAPALEPREDRTAADRRPHDADPRHLRAARALARRSAAGRARAAALPAVEPDRRRRRALAARRRRRHARSRRDEARSRPAQDPAARHAAAAPARRRAPAARDAPRRPRARSVRRAGRVHQRRQIFAAQPARRLAAAARARSSPTSRSRRSIRRCAALTSHRIATCVSPTRSASSPRSPQELVNAFRATLEELDAADLLLHVSDAANPDWPRQKASVEAILRELKLDEKPLLSVFNKIDRLDPAARVVAAAGRARGQRVDRAPGSNGCARRSRSVCEPPEIVRRFGLRSLAFTLFAVTVLAACAGARARARAGRAGRPLRQSLPATAPIGRAVHDADPGRRSRSARANGTRRTAAASSSRAAAGARASSPTRTSSSTRRTSWRRSATARACPRTSSRRPAKPRTWRSSTFR